MEEKLAAIEKEYASSLCDFFVERKQRQIQCALARAFETRHNECVAKRKKCLQDDLRINELTKRRNDLRLRLKRLREAAD